MGEKAIITNHAYSMRCLLHLSQCLRDAIKDQLLLNLSVGLYCPWATANLFRHLSRNCYFFGKSFNFSGTGKYLFEHTWPLALLTTVLSVCLPIFGFTYGMPILKIVILTALPVAFLVCLQRKLLFVLALNKLSWNEVPIICQISRSKVISHHCQGWLLSILSLGIYLPVYRNNWHRLVFSNLSCNELYSKFTGSLHELLEDYAFCIPMLISTLGLSLPWQQARLHRYYCANIWIGGDNVGCSRLYMNLTGTDLLAIKTTILFLRICSLGMLNGWCRYFLLKNLINSILLVGNLRQPIKDNVCSDSEEGYTTSVSDYRAKAA